MKPVIVINRLAIKEGKMDEFIALQRAFGAEATRRGVGLVGGRMYRSTDGTSATLVSIFASASAQEAIRRDPAFNEHLKTLAPLVESSSPGLYEEAYTCGAFA